MVEKGDGPAIEELDPVAPFANPTPPAPPEPTVIVRTFPAVIPVVTPAAVL
jgi:hypothetical protein